MKSLERNVVETALLKMFFEFNIFSEIDLWNFITALEIDQFRPYEDAFNYMLAMTNEYEPNTTSMSEMYRFLSEYFEENPQTIESKLRYAIKKLYGEDAMVANVVNRIMSECRMYSDIWHAHMLGERRNG